MFYWHQKSFYDITSLSLSWKISNHHLFVSKSDHHCWPFWTFSTVDIRCLLASGCRNVIYPGSDRTRCGHSVFATRSKLSAGRWCLSSGETRPAALPTSGRTPMKASGRPRGRKSQMTRCGMQSERLEISGRKLSHLSLLLLCPLSIRIRRWQWLIISLWDVSLHFLISRYNNIFYHSFDILLINCYILFHSY